MGGTKIFVFQLKDIIRVGIFTVLGIIVLILLLVFLLPRGGRGGEQEVDLELGRFPVAEGQPPARYIPGTHSSTIILNGEPVNIRVTVSENEILAIYMTDMAEIQQVFYPLFEPSLEALAEEILRYQSAHIVPQTDNPVTTGILHQAVLAALELALVE